MPPKRPSEPIFDLSRTPVLRLALLAAGGPRLPVTLLLGVVLAAVGLFSAPILGMLSYALVAAVALPVLLFAAGRVDALANGVRPTLAVILGRLPVALPVVLACLVLLAALNLLVAWLLPQAGPFVWAGDLVLLAGAVLAARPLQAVVLAFRDGLKVGDLGPFLTRPLQELQGIAGNIILIALLFFLGVYLISMVVTVLPSLSVPASFLAQGLLGVLQVLLLHLAAAHILSRQGGGRPDPRRFRG